MLYMAALTATRYNPVIKKFYQRLLGEGINHSKWLITACMRKLLAIINVMVRDGSCWKNKDSHF